MADTHTNSVKLYDNLKVSVEIGNYGKYLKLSRKDKWISLSEKTWIFLRNNIRCYPQHL